MPEREISDQFRRVYNWVREIKGGKLVGLDVNVWMVDGQPIAFSHREGKFFLHCTDKHAEELEQAGIVNFSEVQESTK